MQCKIRQAARDNVTGDGAVVQIAADERVIKSRFGRSSEFFRTGMRGCKKMIAASLDCLAIVLAAEPETHPACLIPVPTKRVNLVVDRACHYFDSPLLWLKSGQSRREERVQWF